MPSPLKVLNAIQMREIDRRTIDSGIPSLILMENAAQRVVELLADKFASLHDRRIVVFCGRGNNGGDGLAVARQVLVRYQPRDLHVILTAPPIDLSRDVAANLKMLEACGGSWSTTVPAAAHAADILVDGVLGTGIAGAASGPALDAIRSMNRDFPLAKVVAIDVPSGMPSESATPLGEYVRADYTVTFTAHKICHVLAPACDLMGEISLGQIGTPASLYENDPGIKFALVSPEYVASEFAPRAKESNKGSFGHVLVVGGSRGKAGAAAMTGIAALRAGSGLVTVASAASAIPLIASSAPELMTVALDEAKDGTIAASAFAQIVEAAERCDVVAVGPGLGTEPETVALVQRLYRELNKILVIDADGLNALAGSDWIGSGFPRVLTPHPGEMGRLIDKPTDAVQADRPGAASGLATALGVDLVLKGNRTLLAQPDGQIWVNPTGSPALATAGSGDVLTGMVASLLGQAGETREEIARAIAAAVYLHGLAGEIGGRVLGERGFLATDILKYLPDAMRSLQQHVSRTF